MAIPHQTSKNQNSSSIEQRFGTYYKYRDMLSKLSVQVSYNDVLDHRFLSLGRMDQIYVDNDYKLPNINHIDYLKDFGFVFISFPGQPNPYYLVADELTCPAEEFVLVSTESQNYLLPANIFKFLKNINFAGGDGSKNNPYLIDEARHFDYMRFFPDRHFKQTENINFTGYTSFNATSFEPIGNQALPFSGVFDGNGYTINNLRIHNQSAPFAALFGYTDKSSIIRNIDLKDVDVSNSVHIPKDNLVGGWLANKTKENVFTELTGSSYESLNHRDLIKKDAVMGSAFVFDGMEDPRGDGAHIDLGFGLKKPSWSEFTFSLWLKLNKTRQGGTILGAGRNDGSYGIFEHNHEIHFGARASDSGINFVSFKPEINVWFHIAGVHKPNEYVKLFINGTYIGKTEPPVGDLTTDNLNIGHSSRRSGTWRNGSFLDGKVSRIHIYDKALSDSEIQRLSSLGIAGSVAGVNLGKISNAHSSGTILGMIAGEIAGVNLGTIVDSKSDAQVITE